MVHKLKLLRGKHRQFKTISGWHLISIFSVRPHKIINSKIENNHHLHHINNDYHFVLLLMCLKAYKNRYLKNYLPDDIKKLT